jgi:hypothetical protein
MEFYRSTSTLAEGCCARAVLVRRIIPKCIMRTAVLHVVHVSAGYSEIEDLPDNNLVPGARTYN